MANHKWNWVIITCLTLLGALVVVLVIVLLVWKSEHKDESLDITVVNRLGYRLKDEKKKQKKIDGATLGAAANPLLKHPQETVTLDAIYNTYDQPRACYHSLKSYCENYPEGTVAIYSDGGNPHIEDVVKRIRKEFPDGPTIHWTYDAYHCNVVFPRWRSQDAHYWIKRFHQQLQKLTHRYVILLEDDTWVRRRIQEPPNASIYGGKFRITGNGLTTADEYILPRRVSHWIRAHRDIICSKGETCPPTVMQGQLFGGSGIGGSCIDRQFWLTHYREQQVTEWLRELYTLHSVYHNDNLISILYLAWGGNILPSPEYSETHWRATQWSADRYAIVHAYKKYYVPYQLIDSARKKRQRRLEAKRQRKADSAEDKVVKNDN